MASDVVAVSEQDKAREGRHCHPPRPTSATSTEPQSSPRLATVDPCLVKREDWHSEDEISVGCPSPSADASSDATDSENLPFCHLKAATSEPAYYRPLKKLKMMHLSSPEEPSPLVVTPLQASDTKLESRAVIRPRPVNLTTKEVSPSPASTKAGVKSFSIMDILSHSQGSDGPDAPCEGSNPRMQPPKLKPAKSPPPHLLVTKGLSSSGSTKAADDKEEKDSTLVSIVRPWDSALPSTGNLPFPRLFYNPAVVPHPHPTAAFALQSHFHNMAMAHHVRFLPFPHPHPVAPPGLHPHHHPLGAMHHPGLSPSSGGRASSSSPYSSEGIGGDTDVDVDELSSNTSDSPALPSRGHGFGDAVRHHRSHKSGSKNGGSHAKAPQSGKKPGQGSNGSPLDALFQMTSKTFEGPHGGPEGSGNGNHANLFSNRQATKKKRKSRTAFSNHQIYELEKRFLYQKYLSPADRDEIALSLGLTNAQVITWFQNRRAKLKRDVEELKKDVESAKILGPHRHHHPGPAHGPHGGLLAPSSVAEMTLLQQKADEYQQALQAATGE